MKVLVTGGDGFIGSHLVDALLARGDAVTVLDVRCRNTALDRERLEYRGGSVLDRELVNECTAEADLIVHLAAILGVQNILDDPMKAMRVNVRGTENVLEAAASYCVRTVIASTSEVYGKSAEQPLREDADVAYGPTTLARWSYAYGKALDEFFALALWRMDGLPVTVLRFFNITGPRQSPGYGMVLPRFVDQALRDVPITVYGDGQQTRCFCDVADAVDAILKLAACSAAVGEVVNVGGTNEIAMRDLAEMVKTWTRSRSAVTYVPYQTAYGAGFEDMRRRVPDTTKIERLTGWTATTSLEETILKLIGEAAVARA